MLCSCHAVAFSTSPLSLYKLQIERYLHTESHTEVQRILEEFHCVPHWAHCGSDGFCKTEPIWQCITSGVFPTQNITRRWFEHGTELCNKHLVANHLRPNGINEERAEANVCRRGIIMRDSTGIRVLKVKAKWEVEIEFKRNMNRKGRVWEQM